MLARSALVTSLLVGLAGSAAAAPRKAAVVVAGDIGEPRRDAVEDLVRNRIGSKQWKLVETGPLTATEILEMVQCLRSAPATAAATQKPCADVLVAQVLADRFVVVDVRRDAGAAASSDNATVRAWVLTGRGEVVASASQPCRDCTTTLVTAVVSDAFSSLWRDAQASLATLQVRSVPVGAEIELDGAKVGATDLDIEVPAGVHRVTIRKEGFRPVSEEVTVARGQTVPIQAELVSSTGGPAPAPGRPPLLGPAIVAGTGVAALILAGTLLALDEDDRSTGPIDPSDPEYLDTAPAALGIAGVGIVAIGAAAAWYFWPGSQDRPAEGGVRVGTLPGGGWLGYQSRF
jgi:hypothetical protein